MLGDSELEAGSAQLKQMATGTAKPISLLHFLPEFETEMQNGWVAAAGGAAGAAAVHHARVGALAVALDGIDAAVTEGLSCSQSTIKRLSPWQNYCVGT